MDAIITRHKGKRLLNALIARVAEVRANGSEASYEQAYTDALTVLKTSKPIRLKSIWLY